MPVKARSIPIKEKFDTSALLDLTTEFCPWAGISKGTAYAEIRKGRLKLTKVGRSAKVAVGDAQAWRNSLASA